MLPASPPRKKLERHISRVLGESLSRRLGVRDAASRFSPGQHFFPNPDLVWTQLDGECVLLDLRTRDSFTLNRPGAVVWSALAAGRTLGGAHKALCRQFDVSAKLAWSDLTPLVAELRREGMLLNKRPVAAPPRQTNETRRAAKSLPSPTRENGKGKRTNRTAAKPESPTPPGLFALNALVLEKSGCALLFGVAGGWRKSPACRALIRAGYRCSTAAMPLLRESRAGLELLSLSKPQRRRGRRVPASQSAIGNRQSAIEGPIPPRLLIFPQTVDWPESSLTPLPRSRALEELLPLTLLIRGRPFAPQEFHALARLVETTRCYRLHCGEDVSGLPGSFDQLLEPGSRSIKRTRKPKKPGRLQPIR